MTMERPKLLYAIESALTEVMERDPAEITAITEDTRLFEDLFLDSTSVLELLVTLEDLTGLEVDPEELDMDDFRTVGTLADRVGSQLLAGAPAGPDEA
ncbi:acyl carrier protein [Streptomyces inusitatus]|uniref:Acyl carrier protein n=2 Tax=Streptomyces inusitatus TaxID=68221 RepID=A0A918V017_9ACTN|nr:acyl carrier protein [Streptomyces inusitatus]